VRFSSTLPADRVRYSSGCARRGRPCPGSLNSPSGNSSILLSPRTFFGHRDQAWAGVVEREAAGGPVGGAGEGAQRGVGDGAQVLGAGAAGAEPAAGRRVDRRGELAADPLVLLGALGFGVGDRDRVDEPLRVRLDRTWPQRRPRPRPESRVPWRGRDQPRSSAPTGKKQRTSLESPPDVRDGSDSRHSSRAYRHRGANRHPGGGAVRSGGWPGMSYRRPPSAAFSGSAVIVLPDPDSPTMPRHSPACTDSDTPSTACTTERRSRISVRRSSISTRAVIGAAASLRRRRGARRR
jgi:hypothetical protein